MGRRYLIQHSAGSGTSNSIAWLAHQLIGLERDAPIFNSIVIVTDRLLLDRQIRDTIRQYAQVGATVGHAERSVNLRKFIASGKKIIISTVQKFPQILDEIGNEQRSRRFATPAGWTAILCYAGIVRLRSMRNITVSVDDETYRQSRIRAAELDTSVSALVRGFLEGLVGCRADGVRSETEEERRQRLLEEVLADFAARGVGVSAAENLSRDELYDRGRARVDAAKAARPRQGDVPE